MIFLGDIAHPFGGPPGWAEKATPWKKQPVVANFEGALNEDMKLLKTRRLFNHPSILPSLAGYGLKVAGLANNHIMDLPGQLGVTIDMFKRLGMKTVGAGTDMKSAGHPAIIEDKGERVIILAFGWKAVQCQPASRNQAGVNPLDPMHVLASIRRWRQQAPDAAIVTFLHWNYEMELYPQPAHRQLAFAMVDAGADAVIGHHPHRVGGAEYYKDKIIAYSLGNWWLPHNAFWNGALAYSQVTNLQLALEWSKDSEAVCHWFEYAPEKNELIYESSKLARKSRRIQAMTPFSGMSHKEYIRWFRNNRIKKKLLPVFTDIDHPVRDDVRYIYIKLRHMGVTVSKHIMKQIGI